MNAPTKPQFQSFALEYKENAINKMLKAENTILLKLMENLFIKIEV